MLLDVLCVVIDLWIWIYCSRTHDGWCSRVAECTVCHGYIRNILIIFDISTKLKRTKLKLKLIRPSDLGVGLPNYCWAVVLDYCDRLVKLDRIRVTGCLVSGRLYVSGFLESIFLLLNHELFTRG